MSQQHNKALGAAKSVGKRKAAPSSPPLSPAPLPAPGAAPEDVGELFEEQLTDTFWDDAEQALNTTAALWEGHPSLAHRSYFIYAMYLYVLQNESKLQWLCAGQDFVEVYEKFQERLSNKSGSQFPKHSHERAVSAWVTTVWKNAALDVARTRLRKRTTSWDELESKPIRADASLEPPEGLAQGEAVAAVHAALAGLPMDYRMVMGMRLHGYSFKLIAKEMDISAEYARQLAHRARLRLAQDQDLKHLDPG